MKKERYHRISNRESSQLTQDEEIATSHHDNNSDEESPYVSSDMRRATVRRHESRGSYSSLTSGERRKNTPSSHYDEEEDDNDDNNNNNDDDDDDDDEKEHDHDDNDVDLHSPLSGAKSPLTHSFDSDERPSTPRLHFALDDDDDLDEDYDIHLKRYAIDFGKARETAPDPQTGIIGYLWLHFQTVRQQARQRRAQLLLQQSERHWRQSLYICLVTNLCDATDGGIALAAAALLAWILALWKLETHRATLLFSGLLLWTIRFGARPARQYWIQHRLRQYRPQTQQRYEDNKGFAFAQPPPSTMELSSISEPANVLDILDRSPKNTSTDPAIAII